MCIFCDIVSRQSPADIIWENDDVVCFFPRKPEAYGHCLIVPRRHFDNIFDIDDATLKQEACAAKYLSAVLKKSLQARGVNLLHASGRAAGQSVGHFHLHLLPRYADDGLNAWPHLPKVKFNREELLQKIKCGL